MDKNRLKKIPIFQNLPEKDLAVIATFAGETSVSTGDTLVREGDFSYELMAIEEGTCKVEQNGKHLADLGPGDFFGEMGVLENEMRNSTVTATSPMRLITLTTWEIKRMQKMEGVMEAIQEVIQKRAAANAS